MLKVERTADSSCIQTKLAMPWLDLVWLSKRKRILCLQGISAGLSNSSEKRAIVKAPNKEIKQRLPWRVME
jgi:hypothetical protein